jgi:hypothetical protein
MQWWVDDRTVVQGRAADAGGCDMWGGSTLLAGAAVAFVAAWCGWAARGALHKHMPVTVAQANEMKRMLQDE